MTSINFGFFNELLKLAGRRSKLSPSSADIALNYTKPLRRQTSLKKRFDAARSSARSEPEPLVNPVTALGNIEHLDTLPRHLRGSLITAALEKNKRLLDSARARSSVYPKSMADTGLRGRDREFASPFKYFPDSFEPKSESNPTPREAYFSVGDEADRYTPNRILKNQESRRQIGEFNERF